MSNSSSYSLIDDDHIDDQETINVGNLIIDLESDLEKEKIENEQGSAKSTARSTTSAAASSSTSSSITTSTSSSSGSTRPTSTTSISSNKMTTASGKINQKSSTKHSSISNYNSNSNDTNISSNNNNNNNILNNNNGHLMTSRAVFKSSADEKGELKMRITRETKPGKSEHKIASPNLKSPPSSSGKPNTNNTSTNKFENNNTSSGQASGGSRDYNINIDEIFTAPTQSSSISSTRECGTSTSIGTITEPECLGPCEPGTSVTLEGIVWQETEGGILVVNVTWRGKTYVGALLDCTKHDWAPPRLCDSPASDIDLKANKSVRAKRIVTRSNGVGVDEKNLLQTTGKLRNGKGRRILTTTELASCNKRQRESDKPSDANAAAGESNTSSTTNETEPVPMAVETAPTANNESISTSNISLDKTGPSSPTLIGCTEPNCSKKYRNMNGLQYHQAHAHGPETETSTLSPQDTEKCSSSDGGDDVKQSTSLEKEIVSDQVERDLDKESSVFTPNDPNKNQYDFKPCEKQENKRTPSPKLAAKVSNKTTSDTLINNDGLLNQEPPRAVIVKSLAPDRRNTQTTKHQNIGNPGVERKSPGTLKLPPNHEQAHGSANQNLPFKLGSSSSKQPPPVSLPTTTEEGMKPSGTSTGPPPAPHQANCYFNSAFLANSFNPYGIAPYFSRPPLPPMYDSLAAPTSAANAAFLTRFMNNIRAPPPTDSPNRLLSPSIPKNLPPFPGPMAVPQLPLPNTSMPNMPPLGNPPLPGVSPQLRLPGPNDPICTSSALPFPPPPPPPSDLSSLGIPGLPTNPPPPPLGPLSGLSGLPGIADDLLAKQFPRRFN